MEKSAGDACRMETVKTPPVVGIRATSPREVLNVERSSWANCFVSSVGRINIFWGRGGDASWEFEWGNRKVKF